MRTLIVISSVILAGLFASCQKKELPVPAHDPGNVTTSSVNMSADYKYQVYFDLKTNTMVGQNLKTSWDIGFETSSSGFHVVLNMAKAMYARNTGVSTFSLVTDTNGFALNKKWDEPSGDLDSTAIGDWRTASPVYVIDRGYNENGQLLGMRKLQILSYSTTGYSIRLSNINGSGDVTIQVPKDSLYNLSFVSFDNGGQVVNVEPPKAQWDLVFTQYVHIFHNPTMPYLVTGCMLNRSGTTCELDSTVNFNTVTMSSINTANLVPDINAIGYEWKAYVGSVYITKPYFVYMIRDREGYYYKLHFTDFYNSTGQKGNPKFEYQQL